MAATLADLINRLRAKALDRPMVDFLAGTLNNTDVTSAFTVADGAFLATGGIADFDDGTFEACMVSTKPTQATGVFQRGWESVTAAHANAARMRVNPRYRAYQYREAVNMALGPLEPVSGATCGTPRRPSLRRWASSRSLPRRCGSWKS